MAAICPYCRTPVLLQPGEGTACEGCGTPHHLECYEENGGCTLFGCKFAPADDPKVQVSTTEVAYAAAAGARPTGFGDVSAFGDVIAPLQLSTVAVAEGPPPPPPPPPGTGLAVPAPPPLPVAGTLFAATTRPPKARLKFILLGIFLGVFGIHNFYAGYWKRGLAQIALTVLTVFYAAAVTWLWALVEVCTVDSDSDNVSFV